MHCQGNLTRHDVKTVRESYSSQLELLVHGPSLEMYIKIVKEKKNISFDVSVAVVR